MGSLNKEFVFERLRYLKKLVMTQGRFLEETDLTLEFASCEKPVQSSETATKLVEIKSEPIDNCFLVPPIKQEVQDDSIVSTGLIEECLQFPMKQEACRTEELEAEQMIHEEALGFEAYDETLNFLKEE